MLGRTIAPEEDVKGAPHHMVVTHRFWQEFLSGDPQVLGRSVVLNGDSYTVIGVMPRGFAAGRVERATASSSPVRTPPRAIWQARSTPGYGRSRSDRWS